MSHPQGQRALRQQLYDEVGVPLSIQEETDLLPNLLGTTQLVSFQSPPELAVAHRGVVEVHDGLMEPLRRETGHHLLEAAEGLGALIKIHSGAGTLEANAVFHMVVHPPAVAILILIPVFSIQGRHKAQGLHGMMHTLGSVTGHSTNVLHQGRNIREHMAVHLLQLIHTAPVGNNAIGLVNVPEAIALTGHRPSVDTKREYSLFHFSSSKPFRYSGIIGSIIAISQKSRNRFCASD